MIDREEGFKRLVAEFANEQGFYGHIDERYAYDSGYDAGYDAGRSAREWRRVEEVGLPTVSGKYIVLRCEIVTGEIEPDVDEFKDGQFNPFLADVIAYIGPLPIYVENENAN